MKLVVEHAHPEVDGECSDLYLSWKKARLRNIHQYRNQLETDMILLRARSGDKVLDVGCAFGFSLMEFANLGFDCSGIDAAKEFVQVANTVSSHFGLRTNIIIGDAHRLPYSDNSFDAVMSTEFFSHVANHAEALNEQIRVLKGGGRLLIRDGNILCPIILYDLLFAWVIRTRGKHGGIKWILTRKRVLRNYLGRGFDGKCEDIKSLYWWKKTLSRYNNVEIEVATTGYAHRHPRTPKVFEPFLGNIIIVARKTE